MNANAKINGTEYQNAREALAAAGRGVAINLNGKILVVAKTDARRLEASGTEFAYLVNHRKQDGTRLVLSIPAND